MKRFSAIWDMIVAKYVSDFDWWAMILTPLVYGIALIKNAPVTWSMYQFKDLFLGFAFPGIFGIIFIVVSISMFIAKRVNHKRVTALALSLSSFAWSVIGIMFIFAIPSNNIWLLCIVMVCMGWKIGAEQ